MRWFQTLSRTLRVAGGLLCAAAPGRRPLHLHPLIAARWQQRPRDQHVLVFVQQWPWGADAIAVGVNGIRLQLHVRGAHAQRAASCRGNAGTLPPDVALWRRWWRCAALLRRHARSPCVQDCFLCARLRQEPRAVCIWPMHEPCREALLHQQQRRPACVQAKRALRKHLNITSARALHCRLQARFTTHHGHDGAGVESRYRAHKQPRTGSLDIEDHCCATLAAMSRAGRTPALFQFLHSALLNAALSRARVARTSAASFNCVANLLQTTGSAIRRVPLSAPPRNTAGSSNPLNPAISCPSKLNRSHDSNWMRMSALR